MLQHTHASYLERVSVLVTEKFRRVAMGRVLGSRGGKERVLQSPFVLELQTESFSFFMKYQWQVEKGGKKREPYSCWCP